MEVDKFYTPEIIFEDDYYLIVNKPQRILVHPSHYARNIKGPTLVDYLKHFFGDDISPVNRLDYKTTGIVVFSKQREYTSLIQSSLKESKKTYHAILRGFTDESGVIDSRVKPKDSKIYKEAKTKYKLIQKFEIPISAGKYPSSRYSLVEYYLKTGRRHQLRIHSAKIKHPIIGDHKYGDRHHNKLFENTFNLPYMFLHSKKLEFNHFKSKDTIYLNQKCPIYWESLCGFLKQYVY